MAPLSNRPSLGWLLDTVKSVPAAVLSSFDDGTGSYPCPAPAHGQHGWAEERSASTRFDGGQTTISNPEMYDGQIERQDHHAQAADHLGAEP